MNLARARFVGRAVGGLLTGEIGRAVGLRATVGGDGEDRPDRQQQRARAVRQTLEELGPLYIKLGPMLSTRPDVCPECLMNEFEHLHAKVSVSPFSEFEPVLEANNPPATPRQTTGDTVAPHQPSPVPVLDGVASSPRRSFATTRCRAGPGYFVMP